MGERGLLSRLQAGRRSTDPAASIAAHVAELLNARRGCSETAPSYGVVDFNDVVHTMPDGLRTLLRSIRDTILEHEPRLQHVSVRPVPSDDPLTLEFEVTGRLAEDPRQRLRLHTQLRSGGMFVVQ